MKKFFYSFSIFLFSFNFLKAQSITVTGQCITDTLTLNSIGNVNGKPAYEVYGAVKGFANVQTDVYWLTPQNLWVLAFSGQPYFQNPCNTALPPATGGPCDWTTVSGQPCLGANPLVISGIGSTLPVTIVNFTAKAVNKAVSLSWQTLTEINNKGFEIQRSTDGIAWGNIGFVNGSINSSIAKDYDFIDANPLPGIIFYRLAQVDLDDKTTYSPIVSISFLQPGIFYITNNPGNGLYKLYIANPGNEKINFSIIDAAGKRIISKVYNGPGYQTIDITNYSSGIYLLQIQKGNDVFTERIIKL
jgi:hypothetical protein